MVAEHRRAVLGAPAPGLLPDAEALLVAAHGLLVLVLGGQDEAHHPQHLRRLRRVPAPDALPDPDRLLQVAQRPLRLALVVVQHADVLESARHLQRLPPPHPLLDLRAAAQALVRLLELRLPRLGGCQTRQQTAHLPAVPAPGALQALKALLEEPLGLGEVLVLVVSGPDALEGEEALGRVLPQAAALQLEHPLVGGDGLGVVLELVAEVGPAVEGLEQLFDLPALRLPQDALDLLVGPEGDVGLLLLVHLAHPVQVLREVPVPLPSEPAKILPDGLYLPLVLLLLSAPCLTAALLPARPYDPLQARSQLLSPLPGHVVHLIIPKPQPLIPFPLFSGLDPLFPNARQLPGLALEEEVVAQQLRGPAIDLEVSQLGQSAEFLCEGGQLIGWYCLGLAGLGDGLLEVGEEGDAQSLVEVVQGCKGGEETGTASVEPLQLPTEVGTVALVLVHEADLSQRLSDLHPHHHAPRAPLPHQLVLDLNHRDAFPGGHCFPDAVDAAVDLVHPREQTPGPQHVPEAELDRPPHLVEGLAHDVLEVAVLVAQQPLQSRPLPALARLLHVGTQRRGLVGGRQQLLLDLQQGLVVLAPGHAQGLLVPDPSVLGQDGPHSLLEGLESLLSLVGLLEDEGLEPGVFVEGVDIFEVDLGERQFLVTLPVGVVVQQLLVGLGLPEGRVLLAELLQSPQIGLLDDLEPRRLLLHPEAAEHQVVGQEAEGPRVGAAHAPDHSRHFPHFLTRQVELQVQEAVLVQG